MGSNRAVPTAGQRPVRAARGGVLERDGHTEAAVDLSLLAGLSGVTTMCEILFDSNQQRLTAQSKTLASSDLANDV